jgi:hypothetical protein
MDEAGAANGRLAMKPDITVAAQSWMAFFMFGLWLTPPLCAAGELCKGKPEEG